MNYPMRAATATMMNLTAEPWLAINDAVMGGVSTGGMSLLNEELRFHGHLSLENNGGFSSVRRLLTEDTSRSSGFRLWLQGDGRTYQFRLRQLGHLDGISWRYEFSTDGSVQTFDILYQDLEPVFRGRPVDNAGIINPARIKQVGFLIADKTEGEFSLLVHGLEILN